MTKKKGKLAPRKVPRQERARATVESILQAATYILLREGWDRFTTNRVAERAGVNIASLYQYFPSKEAIVAELSRRHAAEARAQSAAGLEALSRRKTLRAALRLAVEGAVSEHAHAPALHRLLTEELPRSARPKRQAHPGADEAGRRLAERFAAGVPDVELAAWVCRVASQALVHEAAQERPELLRSPLFVEEVVTLLARYLKRPAARARKGRAAA